MIPWHDIDTVLLDMDGTLLDLHFDNYFWLTHLPARYAQAHGVALEEARGKLAAHIKAHEGTLKWYCLTHWSESLNMDIRALKEEVKDKIGIRPFVGEFLQRLQRLNKKLVLITNAHPQSLDLKLEITRIDRWLDMVISSHQFQYPKEEQEFWPRLQVYEHFDPERTLFIDDTTRILRSAQTFGIRHLLCVNQPDSQTVREAVTEFPAINHFDEIFPPVDDGSDLNLNRNG
ncbi:GMP/IMP nucleotidase [Gilvimarinus sp. F26214L]|uniref:GMP/IMP nucleotidase n=1 Tax=Gilvimarinus sp. DZF01 TaxID=3461371 RepID=UPI0040451FC4